MNTDILKLIRNTLETIHVSGHEDIDAMLGCMNALDAYIKSSESETVDNG